MLYFSVYLKYAGEGFWHVIETWHYADRESVVTAHTGFDQWFDAECEKQNIVAQLRAAGWITAGEVN